MNKKRSGISLAALAARQDEARARMGEEAYLLWKADQKAQARRELQRLHVQWQELMEDPEIVAKQTLSNHLKDALNIPAVKASETCKEIVQAIVTCLEHRWGLHDAEEVLAPIGEHFQKAKARNAVSTRLSNDPKQLAKQNVRDCWDLWQKDPSRYAGPTAFARDMLEKFEHLESLEVVMRWCRGWKETTTKPDQ